MKRAKRSVSDKKENLVARLVGDYDVPPELLNGGCFVEIRGRNSIIVRGCRKVVKYSTENIVLKLKRDLIEITGKKLICLTYLSGALSVEGIIDSLSFVKMYGGEE